MSGIVVVTLEKKLAWSRPYDFDFSAFTEFADGNETISSSTVSYVSIPPGDTSLVKSGPSFSGSLVQVQLSGGSTSATYALECTIQTTDGLGGGSILTREGNLIVVP